MEFGVLNQSRNALAGISKRKFIFENPNVIQFFALGSYKLSLNEIGNRKIFTN